MKAPISFTILLFTLLMGSAASGQNNITSDLAVPYCLGITYTANAGQPFASTLEPNNVYDCLQTQPNPSWYFLKCGQSGSIDLSLFAPQDIDFIIYGPFANYAAILNSAGNLQPTQVIDCSYSATNNETPSIPNMQSGDYYLMLVTNYANSVQDITLSQTGGTGTLDCSVYNESALQYFEGTTFYDYNQNGILDGNDYGIPSATIEAQPMNQNVLSGYNGHFGLYNQSPDTVDYMLMPTLNNWVLTTADTIEFTLDSTNSVMDSLFFGFYPDTFFYSLNAVPFFDAMSCVNVNQFCLDFANNGTLPAQAEVVINIDSLLYYQSSSQAPDSINGNQIIFSFDSLNPLNFYSLCVNLLPDTTLMVGDTLVNNIIIYSKDTLGNSIDTIEFNLVSEVICSYDPNFKQTITSNIVDKEIIQPDERITYIVHFQNTGSAPALTVEIEDQISSLLDMNTFGVVSYSHPMQTVINSSNQITFQFNNINLPDSTSDEPGSHGYVIFQISPNQGLVPNQVIQNTASIYFDNNSPIITNTTVNIIDCYILPDQPVFTEVGDIIQTNLNDPYYNYLWYYNDTLIVGENSNELQATNGSGTYTVVISNQYGCQTTAQYSYTAGIDELKYHYIIYPNPSSDQFTIELNPSKIVSFKIFDESGRIIVQNNEISSTKINIEASLLSEGIYFIQFTDTSGKSSQTKIIKL
ncbi:T9SS type A sorting domain-containing protein [Paracrocinitomix mangrovi]|uniref:T9SS type A sorting domain-containing protein n=1 Tax=Paracrocinitomix mangrovi TaxID=2862509 RepID=UPI001C8EE0AB|nr:T9SS type A sorting domain-containing protein [Paracrocinitomix mangrovi]UKN01782.1 T9SS type A sorting domain-containing protein [Paracrocinitomix mangrovi]